MIFPPFTQKFALILSKCNLWHYSAFSVFPPPQDGSIPPLQQLILHIKEVKYQRRMEISVSL